MHLRVGVQSFAAGRRSWISRTRRNTRGWRSLGMRIWRRLRFGSEEEEDREKTDVGIYILRLPPPSPLFVVVGPRVQTSSRLSTIVASERAQSPRIPGL